MIIRHWQGWTLPENANAYEKLLRYEVFPAIANRCGEGLISAELLRREAGNEVEFVTLLRFSSIDAIKKLAGDDHERAHIPDEARRLLSRHDERAFHYTLVLP